MGVIARKGIPGRYINIGKDCDADMFMEAQIVLSGKICGLWKGIRVGRTENMIGQGNKSWKAL